MLKPIIVTTQEGGLWQLLLTTPANYRRALGGPGYVLDVFGYTVRVYAIKVGKYGVYDFELKKLGYSPWRLVRWRQ